MTGPKLADHLLDASVDVRTVECRDARFHEDGHVPDGLGTIDAAMATGQMPAALDQTRNVETRFNLKSLNTHDLSLCGDPWQALV